MALANLTSALRLYGASLLPSQQQPTTFNAP
jgi:hypothetical protein